MRSTQPPPPPQVITVTVDPPEWSFGAWVKAGAGFTVGTGLVGGIISAAIGVGWVAWRALGG